jgi:hypothetical protein
MINAADSHVEQVIKVVTVRTVDTGMGSTHSTARYIVIIIIK